MKYTTSVAMTTYNGAKYVVEQLQSIYEQSQKVSEVIIFDDRSTDNTVKLVNDFIKLRKLESWKVTVNSENLGFSDNFWKAINACQGGVIFLSDQDDIWYPNKVESIMSIMNQDSPLMMITSSYDVCDSEGSISSIAIPYERKLNDDSIQVIEFSELIGRSAIRGCSVSFKKDLLNNERFVSLDTRFGHDWLISTVAAMKGSAVFYNKILFKYRVHSANTSLQKVKFTRLGLIAMVNKRIKGTKEEIVALSYMQNHSELTDTMKEILTKQSIFANRRRNLIENLNLLQIFPLACSMKMYSPAYKRTFISGLRSYTIDIISAFLKKMFQHRDLKVSRGR